MEIKNFAIIQGQGIVNDGKIVYQGIPSKNFIEIEGDGNLNDPLILNLKKYPPLLVRSDEVFVSGSLEFKIRNNSKNSGVLLILKTQDGKNLLCGASLTEHKFVITEESSESKWQSVVIKGSLTNYEENKEIVFKIQVNGSAIKLFINDILMCESNVALKESPIEFRCAADREMEIYSVKVEKSLPKIFVVMQFSKEYNELFEEVIKPVAEEFKYECIRGDEFYASTPILEDIIASILNSSAIIAEITPDNPNVFYEIGYSHAIGKPTILLCDKSRAKLPFDLSGFRTLFYENTIAGKKRVEASLRRYLENIK